LLAANLLHPSRPKALKAETSIAQRTIGTVLQGSRDAGAICRLNHDCKVTGQQDCSVATLKRLQLGVGVVAMLRRLVWTLHALFKTRALS